MKNIKLVLLAGAAFGLTLSLAACEKKSEDTAPSSVGSSQAPAPEKSTPDSSSSPSSPSQGSSDMGASGSPQGQKPDDASKAPKG